MALHPEQIKVPYPGLRPFQSHEASIFFGRSEHVADMLTVLEDRRFLAVVGPSGSGKSSLVLAGLLPALMRGELLTARSDDWRIVTFRPGDSPFRNLAVATQHGLRASEGSRQFHDGDAEITELVLRGSPSGFVQTLRDAGIPEKANVLIVVDQFEELFRFGAARMLDAGTVADRRDDAATFIRLLLDTVTQVRRPVYVMLTMRTDFLGECDVFDGLPQAINNSQYLTPRLNLAQLTEAIARPIELPQFQGKVSQEVVKQILNDIGTGRDELPIVQHVMFRAWQCAKGSQENGHLEITLAAYEMAGGLKNALSLHADEALEEFKARGQEELVEKVFRGLCMRGSNGQPIRRPATILELSEESGFGAREVKAVVEAFRREDRCFLTPPVGRELTEEVKIDISHESLLRQWGTLKVWIEEESELVGEFVRIRDASQRWPEREPLLHEPALGIALKWRDRARPAPAWAERYGGGLARALEYLQTSEEVSARETRASEEARRQKLKDAEDRANEQARNAKRFMFATIALLIVIIAGVLVGLHDRTQSQQLDVLGAKNIELTKRTNDYERQKGQVEAQFRELDAQSRELDARRKELGDYAARVAESKAMKIKMEANITELEKQSLELLNRQKELESEKSQAEAQKAAQVRELDALNMEAAALAQRREKLQQAVDAQDAIRRAGGVVSGSTADSVTISFDRSKAPMDAAIAALAHVDGVQTLILSRTSITDAELAAISELPNLNLKSLDVSHTDISDNGTAHIANMVQLARLNLDDTLIGDGAVQHLEHLGGTLKELDISHNRISSLAVDNLESELGGQCRITYVADPLCDELTKPNAVLDKALEAVQGEHSQGVVIFKKSPITDAALRFLSGIGDLRGLELRGCPILTNDGLRYVSRITDLRSLTIDSCPLITDEGLEGLGESGNSNLSTLTFKDMNIGKRGFDSLRKLKGLTNITLWNTGSQITADEIRRLQDTIPGLKVKRIEDQNVFFP